MDIVDRIRNMEEELNYSEKGIKSIKQALDDFKNLQERIKVLDQYYGSEDWFSDIEEYESGNISSEVNAGVLSEDEAYDVLMENRKVAIEMLEIATNILKNE